MRKSVLSDINLKETEVKSIQQIILQMETDNSLYDTLSNEIIIKVICVILLKSSYHRTTQEIEILKRGTKNNEFFQNLIIQTQGDYLWERCLRKMTYIYVKEGNYLFREGDRGTTFYIILQGSVQIVKRLEINPGEFHERELVVLHNGQSFGELALENDAPRSASVRAHSDVHLAVLDAEDYMVIKKTFQNQQRQLYFEEFAKLNLFQNWKFMSIKLLFDCITFHKYGLNHTIYREGDPSNEIYIIQTGEFKVIKSLRPNQVSEPNPLEKDDLEFLKEQFAYNKPMQSNQERIDQLYQRKKYGNLIASEKKLLMTLKFLGAGEMFGELEILKSTDLVRQFSVVSTYESNKVYTVSKKDFLRVINHDLPLYNSLSSLNDSKLKQILSQIKVYEKNFIDQSVKQQQLEKTQNKDYLNPQQIINEMSNKQNRSSNLVQKISSRRIQNDNKTRELTLTLESPEIEHTLSNHFLKTTTNKNLRQKTAEMSKTPRKSRKQLKAKKLQNDVSSFASNFNRIGTSLNKSPLHIMKSPQILSPIAQNERENRTRTKYSNTQLFFKTSLPLVLQNNYIRFKTKINNFNNC